MDAAVVGLLGALLGILLSNLLSLAIESRRRRQRTEDIVVAIHAEILAGMSTARQQTTKEESDYVAADVMPFGMADRSDVVFASIRSDLTILPMQVIHQVVRYYKLVEQTNIITDGFLHPAFAAQPDAAREKYKRAFIQRMRELSDAAAEAVEALERHAAGFGADLGGIRRLRAPASDERNDGSAGHGSTTPS